MGFVAGATVVVIAQVVLKVTRMSTSTSARNYSFLLPVIGCIDDAVMCLRISMLLIQ